MLFMQKERNMSEYIDFITYQDDAIIQRPLTLLQKKRTTASATEGRPSSEKQALRKRYSSRWAPPLGLRRAAILMTSNASWRWQIYTDKSRPLKNDKNPRFSTKLPPWTDYKPVWFS